MKAWIIQILGSGPATWVLVKNASSAVDKSGMCCLISLTLGLQVPASRRQRGRIAVSVKKQEVIARAPLLLLTTMNLKVCASWKQEKLVVWGSFSRSSSLMESFSSS